jgi:molecular chaperone DnaK (HSP70)
VRAQADAKNAVETYIYSIRDKLTHELKSYSSDAERDKITPQLTAAEEWLYNDDDTRSKSVRDVLACVCALRDHCVLIRCVQAFVAKLNELKALTENISMRHRENEVDRPEAYKAL